MNGGRYTEDDHAERERLRVEVEGQVTPAPPPLLAFLSATYACVVLFSASQA